MLKIALDYDSTYTADPTLWDIFVNTCKYRGHEVKFVTYRYPTESKGIVADAKRIFIPIIFTSRKPKRDFYDADIWIDDFPETIVREVYTEPILQIDKVE